MDKKQTQHRNLPLVLIILDGWGIAPPNKGNAVTLAKTPVMSSIARSYSYTQLAAHGLAVGLPPDQDGNSEAGHMNIGAGRVVIQDTVMVSRSINSGQFFKNPAFKAVVQHCHKHNSAVHLIGLLSGWESAHSDPDHLLALLTYLRINKVKKVYLHLFTDGRDSYKYGAQRFYSKLKLELLAGERVASICGRFYAMDRKKKWERTETTYNMLVLGEAECKAKSFGEAIHMAYKRGESDEFIKPTVVVDKNGNPVATIDNNDAIIFFNLRSDRARQITKAFAQQEFNKKNKGSFKRKRVVKDLVFVAMTDFGPDLEDVLVAFPSMDLKGTLPMVLQDLKQLYISETEKYAHVTYFFNGGYDHAVAGEERVKISSPDVASYDLRPEMSAFEVTRFVIDKIKSKKIDFVCVNFANPDMVGHTGNLVAGIRAVEEVDKCVGQIIREVRSLGGTALITADHGNAEEMINLETGEIDTKHSIFPVPLVVVNHVKSLKLRKDGVLADVAPTILDLLARSKPREMTGESLIVK